MKTLNITKKNVLILILVFSIIFCISGACGFLLWRNNMAINIDSEATYYIGDADLTLLTQYTELTETFLLSFIFVFYGLCVGFVINTLILLMFTIVKIVTNNQGNIEQTHGSKIDKYKEKHQRNIEKAKYKQELKAIKAGKDVADETTEEKTEDVKKDG